jgi:hypothetical protein
MATCAACAARLGVCWEPLSDARLVIPHAVLCSEMGAHFSPCGRLLAACVACLPKDAPEPVAGEPIPRLVYELRVYSLEEKNFGEVLAARSVRAAHCLTSIQFSPTSEHVLLAYGRRHSSLLRSRQSTSRGGETSGGRQVADLSSLCLPRPHKSSNFISFKLIRSEVRTAVAASSILHFRWEWSITACSLMA